MRIPLTSLLLCGTVMIAPAFAQELHVVDLRYMPREQWSVIGLPDDWQKTMVSWRGELCYDFGPGPYARPLTKIRAGMTGDSLISFRQTAADMRVPIVTTISAGKKIEIRTTTFAVVPGATAQGLPSATESKIERGGGYNGCIAWVQADAAVDSSFRGAAWGTNRPIYYRLRTIPGEAKKIGLGLCESYKPRAGMRVLEMHVEGCAPVTVDPFAQGGKNVPLAFLFDGRDADNDGWLSISVHASLQSPDPNVFLNCIWVFPAETPLLPEEMISGIARTHAELVYACGGELLRAPQTARVDVLDAHYTKGSGIPTIIVDTRRVMNFDAGSGTMMWEGKPWLTCAPAPTGCTQTAGGWLLTFPAGTRRVTAQIISGGDSVAADVARLEKEAKTFWLSTAHLPYRTIIVPDSGIQRLLDASVRNMYQVREKVDGYHQFQPGPTVYRGFWLGDVELVGSTLLSLGDARAQREFLESGFRFQLPSGQMRLNVPTVAIIETPVFVDAVCRYARSTGDKEWLRGHWQQIRECLEWVCQARASTLGDSTSLYRGLMPPGFVDGGLSTPVVDYGAALWGIIALEEGANAARWLGHDVDEKHWLAEAGDLHLAFARAALKDIRKDRLALPFLPVSVGDTSTAFPQRGQWTIVFPSRYGDFFQERHSVADSILRMNLAMLDAHSREGIVQNSGWLNDGLWPWLGGVQGMAHLTTGDPKGAVDILYAYANHATQLGTWVEEQLPVDVGISTTGDVSDAEASAVFIQFVRYLIVTERGRNLELLGGVPPEWFRPGAHLAVNNAITVFGPVTLTAQVSAAGDQATLRVEPVDGRGSTGALTLDLRPLSGAGFTAGNGRALPASMQIPWNTPCRLNLKRLR
jgi:hypothetical protein